jgi:hypothetical protein
MHCLHCRARTIPLFILRPWSIYSTNQTLYQGVNAKLTTIEWWDEHFISCEIHNYHEAWITRARWHSSDNGASFWKSCFIHCHVYYPSYPSHNLSALSWWQFSIKPRSFHAKHLITTSFHQSGAPRIEWSCERTIFAMRAPSRRSLIQDVRCIYALLLAP